MSYGEVVKIIEHYDFVEVMLTPNKSNLHRDLSVLFLNRVESSERTKTEYLHAPVNTMSN